MLAEVAAGPPLGARLDIAGPETQDLVDMARRTFAARGQDIRLVPTWRGAFGTDMAGEALLPGDGARLGATTFDDWLAAGAAGRPVAAGDRFAGEAAGAAGNWFAGGLPGLVTSLAMLTRCR